MAWGSGFRVEKRRERGRSGSSFGGGVRERGSEAFPLYIIHITASLWWTHYGCFSAVAPFLRAIVFSTGVPLPS